MTLYNKIYQIGASCLIGATQLGMGRKCLFTRMSPGPSANYCQFGKYPMDKRLWHTLESLTTGWCCIVPGTSSNCWIACLQTFTSCITCNRYLKVKKRNSFIIQYSSSPNCLYGEVQVYITSSTPSFRLHLAIIRPLIPTPPSVSSIPPPLKSIIVQVQRAWDVHAVPISAIHKKCVLIAIDSLLYVSMPPNDYEM